MKLPDSFTITLKDLGLDKVKVPDTLEFDSFRRGTLYYMKI